MKNFKDIISRYWKGTSEVEEELELKKHFFDNKKLEIEDEYFSYLEHKRKEKINDPSFDNEILYLINKKKEIKSSLFQKINWQIAAAVLLLFTAATLIINRQATKQSITTLEQAVIIDTYDDPQLAFEETKKALLLISNKLNKGNEYATDLVKFSQTQENIKN